jgi:hypothetical protein
VVASVGVLSDVRFVPRLLRVRTVTALCVTGLALAACDGSIDSANRTTTVVVVDTGVTTTTEPPVHTDAPVETELPTTTDVAPVKDASTTTLPPTTTIASATVPVLEPAALGPLAFGMATLTDAETVLTPFVGTPISDNAATYPDEFACPADSDPQCRSYYENSTLYMGFSYPFGRSVCYGNGLCLHYGGSDESSLHLVGYRQQDGQDSFVTASGVTAGSTGVEFPDTIVAEPGGCHSQGAGSADGVPLLLESSGTPFTEVLSDDGDLVDNIPPTADLLVLSVYAGDEPYSIEYDC